MDVRTERPIVELTDAELDQVVGGGNPHGLNPGGQPHGASASDPTGDPHTKHNSTGDPH